MLPLPKHDVEIYAQIEETARRFSKDVVRPVAEELDAEERFPGNLCPDGRARLFGITVPEDQGGAGLDTLAYAIVMEELSRGYASVADQCGLVELVGTLLSRYGYARRSASDWLPADARAPSTRAAYCITEAEAGSDVAGIRTTAVRDGDGWMLNGGKLWIHNAPVADVGFVLARTDPAAGHRGMSIFIVDLQRAGRHPRPQGAQDGPAGEPGRRAHI